MSFLSLSHLSKTYPRTTQPVVKNLSLDVGKGEIVVLLGSSGCGKTTLLKMIAGLETQDEGIVSIDGANMEGVSAEKRPIAMVFQKALLFRNMTVEQNINFAPRVNRTMTKSEMAAKVEEMLQLIDMEGMGHKKATELSGGQEQRVSLARALITNPKVLLLDEPFSALDAKLRVSMRQHIKRLNRTLGTTMIFVTHDQQEAVEVADRIALMYEGKILQYGKPVDFYERPNSRTVADFFGWRNFIPAWKNGERVECALGSWEFKNCEALDAHGNSNSAIELAIRPEAACEMGTGPFKGRVIAIIPQGPFSLLSVACEDATTDTDACTNNAAKESIVLDLLVKTAEAPAEGETVRFNLSSRMMWPLAK